MLCARHDERHTGHGLLYLVLSLVDLIGTIGRRYHFNEPTDATQEKPEGRGALDRKRIGGLKVMQIFKVMIIKTLENENIDFTKIIKTLIIQLHAVLAGFPNLTSLGDGFMLSLVLVFLIIFSQRCFNPIKKMI